MLIEYLTPDDSVKTQKTAMGEFYLQLNRVMKEFKRALPFTEIFKSIINAAALHVLEDS